MTDLFTEDFSALNNDQRHSAIEAFAQAQPNESNRHDFKVKWTNEAVNDVAAFANTFGGLLIIGVQKGQSDPVARPVGVPSNSELTTGIASAISTNISPTPSYDIMECNKPREPNTRFCVIRVRSDFRLYLVTRKDSPPVFVRDADRTVRANAGQLRHLIDRERQSVLGAPALLHHRAHELLESMPIGLGYNAWPRGNWTRSDTYLKLIVVPAETKIVPLDWKDETAFNHSIHRSYRRIIDTVNAVPPVAGRAANRSADYYEYRWYHLNLGYEQRWRITNLLEVAHATQIKDDGQWSLMDVVAYVILLMKITAERWKSLNYYGDGLLFAELSTDTLPLRQGRAGEFSGLFNPAGGAFAIGPESVVVDPEPRQTASGNVTLSFAGMHGDLPRRVTAIMNSLLRSLGHSVVWEKFEDDMRAIIR